jgi:hypothetical protein
MSQSLSQVYLHVVFSTKDRRPYLQELATRDAVHKCLAKTSRSAEPLQGSRAFFFAYPG